MTRRPGAGLLAALLLVAPVLGAGCRDDTVRIRFRPDVGDVYRYETRVRAESVVTFKGQEPVTRTDSTRLHAEHTVVGAGRDSSRVQVVLEGAGGSSQTFVVRVDRAAQVVAVEQAEGTAREALGQPGLPELFPAAAGAPPDRRLTPGDEWRVDERVQLPGASDRARLRGSGRLVSLGVVDGRDVAEVRTSSRIPVSAVTVAADGELRIDGFQTTTATTRHDLDDGAVRRAAATTTGTYDIVLSPPPGQAADPLSGTLSLRVTSTTRRVSR